MNKKLVILLFAIVSSAFLVAQNQKAIGIRFGGLGGYIGELSYQNPIGAVNRAEFDFGVTPHYFGVHGIYHWINDLGDGSNGFSWYIGPGLSAAFFNTGNSSTEFALGLDGQIGLEYKFNIPLQLSLDYRPTFYLNGFGGFYDNICLSARFCF